MLNESSPGRGLGGGNVALMPLFAPYPPTGGTRISQIVVLHLEYKFVCRYN